jgi:hypothetical protein
VESRLPAAFCLFVRALLTRCRSGDQASNILSQGHGGDWEDEGGEPDDDGEPSLSWGLNGEKSNVSGHDWELANCDRESDEPLLI